MWCETTDNGCLDTRAGVRLWKPGMKSQTASGHRDRTDKSVSPSNTNSAGFDATRDITADRFRRALSEPMIMVFDAPLLARVRHGEHTYTVDLISGSCQCDDYHYRGHSIVCKHSLRAACAALYTDCRTTAFLAHVAQYARNAGCPDDVRGCHGPTTPADRPAGLPCTKCMEAVRAPDIDEFTVWSAFAPPEASQ
jgi:hypothetical protein